MPQTTDPCQELWQSYLKKMKSNSFIKHFNSIYFSPFIQSRSFIFPQRKQSCMHDNNVIFLVYQSINHVIIDIHLI
jgi:hypothetical protein